MGNHGNRRQSVAQRVVSTARLPYERADIRAIQTAPEPPKTDRDYRREDEKSEGDEAVHFAKKYAKAKPKSYNFAQIYQRRNLYASMNEPTWGLPQGDQDGRSDVRVTSSTASRPKTSGSAIVSLGSSSAHASRKFVRTTEPVRETTKLPMLDSEDYTGITQTGDLMKDLLVQKRPRRKHKRLPIEDRITEFYTKLDEVKASNRDPPPWMIRRKWLLLTKGIKAALAESDDEDDDYAGYPA